MCVFKKGEGMVNGDVNAQESNFDIFHACIWVGGSVAAAQNKKMTVKIGLKQYAIRPNTTQGFNKHTVPLIHYAYILELIEKKNSWR